MTRIIAIAATLGLVACSSAILASPLQTEANVDNPCAAPEIQSKIKSRSSLGNPFSRYRLTKTALGARPFGKVIAPATPPGDAISVELLNLDQLESLEPVPEGWFHREFSSPSTYALEEIDGRLAIKGVAEGTGSIFFRHMKIDANEHPILSWTWRVDEPSNNPHCDHLSRGDDKSARLFITVVNDRGRREWLEIIWANHLTPGELSFVHGFPHYVAAGPDTPTGEWISAEVDLRDVFKSFWPRRTLSEVTGIGFMVDSDQHGDRVSSALAEVAVHREIGR